MFDIPRANRYRQMVETCMFPQEFYYIFLENEHNKEICFYKVNQA